MVSAVKGSLRFISGKSGDKAYTIRTPTSTIGVRGTVFDIYVDEAGETTVGLVSGRVEICGLNRRCRAFRNIGRFLRIGRDGAFREATRLDNRFLGGIAAATAFPFLHNRYRLRRAFRAPSIGTRSLIRRATKPRFKLRMPRFKPRCKPKPFKRKLRLWPWNSSSRRSSSCCKIVFNSSRTLASSHSCITSPD